jgi:hypothetical protein
VSGDPDRDGYVLNDACAIEHTFSYSVRYFTSRDVDMLACQVTF